MRIEKLRISIVLKFSIPVKNHEISNKFANNKKPCINKSFLSGKKIKLIKNITITIILISALRKKISQKTFCLSISLSRTIDISFVPYKCTPKSANNEKIETME